MGGLGGGGKHLLAVAGVGLYDMACPVHLSARQKGAVGLRGRLEGHGSSGCLYHSVSAAPVTPVTAGGVMRNKGSQADV